MDLSSVTAFISTVGFPIAVAIYLVVVQRQDLAKLREAISKLTIAIMLMAQKIDVDVIGEEGDEDRVNLLD